MLLKTWTTKHIKSNLIQNIPNEYQLRSIRYPCPVLSESTVSIKALFNTTKWSEAARRRPGQRFILSYENFVKSKTSRLQTFWYGLLIEKVRVCSGYSGV